MNVVDSSAWLEFFADGPNAGEFAAAIEDADSLIVPTITLFEVFKRIRVQRDADSALEAIAFMQRGRPVDLDADLAIEAADLSVDLKLPRADSIILATARRHEAVLWTQDSDFEGIPGVEYRRRRGRRRS
jgi:predicted nucleic acid-binding protein